MHSQQRKRIEGRDRVLPGWRNGVSLQPGDEAQTDYEGCCLKRVIVTRRTENAHSQSKVCLTVTPALKHCTEDTWLDAHWFQPVTPNV